MMELKNVHRGRIQEYVGKFKKAIYVPTDMKMTQPAGAMKVRLRLPSATQNEINLKDAENLVKNGCKVVSEGANMPSTAGDAALPGARSCYGPAKAANCGGVATSGLEMAQNSQRMAWTREEVDKKLHSIMVEVHRNCFETSHAYGQPGNLVAGANIAGFLKVANAMMDQGLV